MSPHKKIFSYLFSSTCLLGLSLNSAHAQLPSLPIEQLSAANGSINIVDAKVHDVDNTTALVGRAVYNFDGQRWNFTQNLPLPAAPAGFLELDGAARLRFANTGDIDGNRIAVTGAFVSAVGGAGGGAFAATVPFFATYTLRGKRWREESVTILPDITTSSIRANLVDDIALDGDQIVIGDVETLVDSNTFDRSGARGVADVYNRLGKNWAFITRLHPDQVERFDWFGKNVAIEGSVIAVAAEATRDPDGVVYVFDNLVLNSVITAAEPGFSEDFGQSVNIDNGRIAVASNFADRGAVYLFERQSSMFRQTARLAPAEDDEYNVYDSNAILSGDTVVLITNGLDLTRRFFSPGPFRISIFNTDSYELEGTFVGQFLNNSTTGNNLLGFDNGLGLISAPNRRTVFGIDIR